MTNGFRRAALAGLAFGGLTGLAACDGQPVDLDLRNLGQGFSTTDAALGATVAPDAAGFAATDPMLAPGTPGAPDLVTSASAAIDRAGPVTTTSLAPVNPAGSVASLSPVAATPAPVAGQARHTVVRGETAYSVARLYGVPVGAIAEANGLGPDLAIREGQALVVPAVAVASAAVPVTQPGQGSPTPVPPSASEPLPDEEPLVAASATAEPDPAPLPQDLGAQQTEASASDAPLVMPVAGSIIRAYAPGRNEGIDISASAGAEVRAAQAGTVAAVTTNTDGIQIVVIRHAGDLLTVYTHVEDLTVAKDATVSQGQTIGRVRAGDPAFLHFEVRQGMESQDPTEFLP